MFDLLGFWFNVSVIVAVLLAPTALVISVVFPLFVKQVTGDSKLESKVSNWICEGVRSGYYSTSYTVVLGKHKVHDALLAVPIAVGTFSWVGLLVGHFVPCDTGEVAIKGTLVGSLGDFAAFLAPYTGSVAVREINQKSRTKLTKIKR